VELDGTMNYKGLEFSTYSYDVVVSIPKIHSLNMSNSTFIEDEIRLQESGLISLNLSNLDLGLTFLCFKILYLENATFNNFSDFSDFSDFYFEHEILTELYINGLKFKSAFNLTLPKLEFLELNYDSTKLLLNSNLPNIQTIRIRNYQNKDVELIEDLKTVFQT
jgi:hypothetical protein